MEIKLQDSKDLREALEGHVTLWAKGWYGNTDGNAYVRLEEIVNEYCGMNDHSLGVRHITEIVTSTYEVLGCNAKELMEAYLRTAADYSEAASSYHLKMFHITPVITLAGAMVSVIANTNTGARNILLPKLLPKLQETYKLDPYPFYKEKV